MVNQKYFYGTWYSAQKETAFLRVAFCARPQISYGNLLAKTAVHASCQRLVLCGPPEQRQACEGHAQLCRESASFRWDAWTLGSEDLVTWPWYDALCVAAHTFVSCLVFAVNRSKWMSMQGPVTGRGRQGAAPLSRWRVTLWKSIAGSSLFSFLFQIILLIPQQFIDVHSISWTYFVPPPSICSPWTFQYNPHSPVPFFIQPIVSVSAACMSVRMVPSIRAWVTYQWTQPPNYLPFPTALDYQCFLRRGGASQACLLWVVRYWVSWSPTSCVGSIMASVRSWARWARHVHRTACHSTPGHLLVLTFFLLPLL